MTLALAMPSFSKDTDLASWMAASAKPCADSSALIPSAILILASDSLAAASRLAVASVVISTALCLADNSSASAFLTWRTLISSASASAARTRVCLERSAALISRTSLIRSSSCATVLSTAIRSRMTFAISFFSSSIARSASIRCKSTSRSRETISKSRARVTFSSSMTTARRRFCPATSISRCWFSRWIAKSCSTMITAVSDFLRSSSSILRVSAVSRAITDAISRRCLASASACWRSSSSIASLVSTFFFLTASSSSRSSSLVMMFWKAVSCVIFLIPSASKILLESSDAFGVCSK